MRTVIVEPVLVLRTSTCARIRAYNLVMCADYADRSTTEAQVIQDLHNLRPSVYSSNEPNFSFTSGISKLPAAGLSYDHDNVEIECERQ